MVDKTSKKLVGKAKNILIQVDNHTFSIYFMILYVKEDPKVPVILKRPFMKTVRMLVDMNKGEVKVRIKYHKVDYKVIGVA